MATLTFPRSVSKYKELVLIPRQEYEEFLVLKKIIPIYKPTHSEKASLRHAEKDYREGKYIEWSQLKHELARSRQTKSRKTANKVTK